MKLFTENVSFFATMHFYWGQCLEVLLDSRMVPWPQIEVPLQDKKDPDHFSMVLSSLLNDVLPEKNLYYSENVMAA